MEIPNFKSDKDPKYDELLARADEIFKMSWSETRENSSLVSHLLGNLGTVVNPDLVEFFIKENDLENLGNVKTALAMLERFFEIKNKHPQFIEKVKNGEYDEHPKFKDIINRTDKSQSELILETLESIVETEE